ncbi:MAG: Enhancer of polycomb-like protein 1 [Claussenomyces sp. TS43310]|nr:MAG: Enhancer of polycomb-like protein 1 [Claussenomyces sp. TS43310]
MRGTQPGLRFRTRKLSPKQPLPVLREDQIESEEYKELLESQFKVETGVEKSEENEYHLQQALAAALGRGSKDAENIVPAPPAKECSDVNYNELYPLELPKLSSYIAFSETVEECTGCQYNMTTDDDIYLKGFNEKQPASSQCSEDDFERIMDILESTAEHQAPFAAVDNTVVAWDAMEVALKQDLDEKVRAFAKDIYEYWKTRRQCSSNRPLQPGLKFEVHQDSDDADPYVCFRRRDVRQTRKTRARDVQSTEKLKRLRKELEEGRQLVALAHQRELAKREQIASDRAIFEQRGKVREVRLRLGIKVDDEDLINQKPQKRKAADAPQRPQGTQIRLPPRSDGRPLEADLTLLSDVIAQKENLLQMEIDAKIQQQQRWNVGHVDLTREPLEHVHPQGVHSSFRAVTTQQQLITPPASVASESDGDHTTPPADKEESVTIRFGSPSDEPETFGMSAYRRRIGRLNRLWIDRKGLSSCPKEMDERVYDRWKYDQDDDDEPIVFEIDPYDTRAIKFRATIPYARSVASQAPNGNAISTPVRPSPSTAPTPQP